MFVFDIIGCLLQTGHCLLNQRHVVQFFFFVFITSKAEIILNFRDNNLKKNTQEKRNREITLKAQYLKLEYKVYK